MWKEIIETAVVSLALLAAYTKGLQMILKTKEWRERYEKAEQDKEKLINLINEYLNGK